MRSLSLIFASVLEGLAQAVLGLSAAGFAQILVGATNHSTHDWTRWTLGRVATAGLLAAVAKLGAAMWVAFAGTRLASEFSDQVRRQAIVSTSLGRCQSVDDPQNVTGQKLPSNDHRRKPHDSTGAIFSRDLAEVRSGVLYGALPMVRAICEFGGLWLTMIFVSWQVALGATLLLALFAGLMRDLRLSWKRQIAKSAAAEAVHLTLSQELVRNVELWRVFRAEREINARLDNLSSPLTQKQARVEQNRVGLSASNEIMGALVLCAIAFFLERGFLAGARADLLPALVILFLAYRPLRAWTEGRLRWSAAENAFGRLAPLRRAEEIPREAPAPFERLQVSHLQSHWGRHSPLSCQISCGEIIGLVGPTGIGKSSLLRVLLGLDPPRFGEMRIGAIDAQSLPTEKRPFAWAPQECPILPGTVLENVMLGGADEQLAFATIQRLELDPAADAGTLSGGERNLLSLARALSWPDRMALLDEPTANLDSDAEKRVLAFLAKSQRTILLVTHKKAPLQICDRILELEEI